MINYKEISKINKEIDRRYEQIEILRRDIDFLKSNLGKSINEYERNYIKMSIGQLTKYHNWLVDEIRYLEEDRILYY